MDNLKTVLEASIRIEKIKKAKKLLQESGGCEDVIEKLDSQIYHISLIKQKRKEQAYEQCIEQAII